MFLHFHILEDCHGFHNASERLARNTQWNHISQLGSTLLMTSCPYYAHYTLEYAAPSKADSLPA